MTFKEKKIYTYIIMENENEKEIINDVIDNIIEEQKEIIEIPKLKRKGRPPSKEGKSKEPEFIKEYNKERYQKNREKLLIDATSRYHCRACNKDIAKSNKSKHDKTISHHENMIELQNLVFKYFHKEKQEFIV